MATLRQQYENYLFATDSKITFEEWERTVFNKKFSSLSQRKINAILNTFPDVDIESEYEKEERLLEDFDEYLKLLSDMKVGLKRKMMLLEGYVDVIKSKKNG
jgi:hypothetical protein